MAPTIALKRLVTDLKEIQENPLDSIVALPVNDNLFEWHANLSSTDGDLKGIPFHMILKFTEEYPKEPPKVFLCTHLPHTNVFEDKKTKSYTICLDMLQQGEFAEANMKGRPYEGWSSSYTVLSMLVQLQSFLMDENFQKASLNKQEVIKNATSFKCSTCSHSPKSIWPTHKHFSVLPVKRVVRPLLLPSREPEAAAAAGTATSKATASSNTSSTSSSSQTTKPVPKKIENEWQVVKSRRSRKNPFLPVVQQTQPIIETPPQLTKEEKKLKRKQEKKEKQKIKEQEENEEEEEEEQPQEKDDGLTYMERKKLATTRRNRAKRAAAKKSKQFKKEHPELVVAKTTAVEEKKEQPMKESKKEIEDDFVEVSKKVVAKEEKPASVATSKTLSSIYKVDVNVKKENSGSFAVFPREVVATLLSYLPLSSIAKVSRTCKYMRQAAEDGYLWKELFSRNHPGSKLTSANLSDWKHVYLLEVNNILGEFHCYYTKASFEDDVLGIPIEFTVNPVTQKTDYIYSSLDILSYTAFQEYQVRKTAWNEKFDLWLPLYITEDHFQRAFPLIKKTLVKLCPHYRSSEFIPDMALDVIFKLMNTMVVLLCDHGIAASNKAIHGYFWFLRLLQRIVEEYPQLQRQVNQEVKRFIQDRKERLKENCPSLGEFLASLCISNVTWPQLAQCFLDELFARNVLWIANKFPSMASVSSQDVVDYSRLSKSWDATEVSSRLVMFHVYFLVHVSKKISVTEIDNYYGRPSQKMTQDFVSHVKKILAAKNWQDFFPMLQLKCPTPLYLTQWLKRSVNESKRSGYHNDHTKFGSIQKSGVSKILLKGQQYSAPKGMKKMMLEDTWVYEGQYLDAVVFLYDTNKKFVDKITYSHNRDASGAVTHSGDIIDSEKGSGKHIVNIDLGLLPKEINLMFMTISTADVVLANIKQPYIRLTDADSDMELCRYYLDPQNLKGFTSAVMCKVYKENDSWHVLAMEELGAGGWTEGFVTIQKTIETKLLK